MRSDASFLIEEFRRLQFSAPSRAQLAIWFGKLAGVTAEPGKQLRGLLKLEGNVRLHL